jgi:hypothetical protein
VWLTGNHRTSAGADDGSGELRRTWPDAVGTSPDRLFRGDQLSLVKIVIGCRLYRFCTHRCVCTSCQAEEGSFICNRATAHSRSLNHKLPNVAAQVIATEFATIAAANNYWRS